MGVVLVALTVALALARQSLVRTIRRALPYVYKVSGVLLVVAGAYVAYYGWYELRVDHGDVSGGGPANFVFRLNGDLSDWIQRTGPVRIGIVLAAAIGVAVAPGHEPTQPLGLTMFAELLAHAGVREIMTLRSTFGFMAFHGGSLEKGTDDIATAAAEAAGASLYAVRAAARPALAHPVGRDRPGRVAGAGRLPRPRRHGRGRARLRPPRHVHHDPARRRQPRPRHARPGAICDAALPDYTVVDDLDEVPTELRGLHPDNPVNRAQAVGRPGRAAAPGARPRPVLGGDRGPTQRRRASRTPRR